MDSWQRSNRTIPMNQLRILVLALGLSSCASVGVTPILDATAKDDDCKLAIYTEAREIRAPYDVVCYIDVMTAGHILADTTIAGAIHVARTKACRCGADAMLIHDARKESGNFWGRGIAILKAIRYKETEGLK